MDRPTLRERTAEVIFGHETRAGRLYDEGLIAAIVVSVLVVILETVEPVNERMGPWFPALEWFFTVVFSLEYLARLWSAPQRLRYATSFYGVVDLVSVLPTYLSLFLGGAQALLTIRALRLLRVFRVLKLGSYTSQAGLLRQALARSREKITVFLAVVVILVIILGSLMYLLEGPSHGFSSIPRSVYWAIVTLTTVGYGDITPRTVAGQVLASLVMILGYGIIAVPTGIVTVELARADTGERRACRRCGLPGLEADARYCRRCGEAVEAAVRDPAPPSGSRGPPSRAGSR
jgi:voltage-gated potassium channel